MKYIALIVLTTLLIACQSAFIDGVPNEASPYFTVPVDSTLSLRQMVTLPAGDNNIYFQRGRAMRWNEVNVYGAYCSLKLAVRRDVAQTVAPDDFAVREVSQERRFRLAQAPLPRRTQLAALGLAQASVLEDDDSDSTYEVLATVMHLQSSRQPDVSEMACADWSTPQGITPISVRKMRQTLGEWFDLQIHRPAL